jgi:tRNA threonylcarbamoyladenosine biosynthesis protein TsaB
VKQSFQLATFLFIDTAGPNATIAICKDYQVLAIETNSESNTHASFVQVAIERAMNNATMQWASIDAIVVTMGPGSYTGLRVGLSSAKGIAYALNKPLIGLSTLSLLAVHASNHELTKGLETNYQIFCMIDARRMEVFGTVYDSNKVTVVKEQPIELSVTYLEQLLQNGALICIGDGVTKTKELHNAPGLLFIDETYEIKDMIQLAEAKWGKADFEDIAYSSPSYLKDFYQIPPKSV